MIATLMSNNEQAEDHDPVKLREHANMARLTLELYGRAVVGEGGDLRTYMQDLLSDFLHADEQAQGKDHIPLNSEGFIAMVNAAMHNYEAESGREMDL